MFWPKDHDGEVKKFVSHLVLAVSKMVKKGRGRPRPFPIFKIGLNMAQSCAKRVHAHTIAFPAYMTVYCFGTVVLSDGPDLVGHVQGYSQLSKWRTTRRPDPCWCYRMLVTTGRNSSLISLEKKILINNSTCSDISGAFPTKNGVEQKWNTLARVVNFDKSSLDPTK